MAIRAGMVFWTTGEALFIGYIDQILFIKMC